MRILDDVRAWRAAKVARRTGSRVQRDDSGLTYFDSDQSSALRLTWLEVTDVFAFKKDCYAVDSIHLILGNSERKVWVEVAEDDAGYPELIAALPRNLPGCPTEDEWFPSVTLPPLETRWTRLYPRFDTSTATTTPDES